jgi:hypothetical protein
MSKETLGVTLAGIPQLASSLVFGLAAYTLVKISAAVMTAHTACTIAKRPRPAA